MKKLFYFFCVASALMCCSSLYGQNGTDSNDALPAFSTIAPSVQLLKTGYPSIKAGNTVPIKYSKDTVQGIHKFIGRKITTDFIKENISSSMVKDPKQWKDTYTKVVNKLIIYCDTLELKETLWVPEATIEIQTRILVMNDFRIKTSALDWQKSNDFASLNSIDEKKGKDGVNAGDIFIRCDKVITTKENSIIEANGGNGEFVFVPKFTVKYPNTQFSMNVYKYCECPGKNNSGRYTLLDAACNMVALIIRNEEFFSLSKNYICWGYKTFDSDLVFSPQNEWNSELKDNAEFNRITYDKNCVPGKGGNGGKTDLVSHEGVINPPSLYNGGKSGRYIARQNDNDVTYGTNRMPIQEIKFIGKVSCIGHVSVDVDKVGDSPRFVFKKDPETDRLVKLFTTEFPSLAAQNKVINDIKAAQAQPDGNKGSFTQSNKTYAAHPEYLQKHLNDLQAQYFVYFKRSPKEKEALNKELDVFVAELAAINKDASVGLERQADYASLYQSAIELSHYRNRNVDEFNNVVGYRPSLSLATTMNYIKEQLGKDIKLFILADMMASQETNAKQFLTKIPEMITDLRVVHKKLYDNLEVQNKAYDDIEVLALKCDRQIDTVKAELLAVEAKLLEKAKSDKDKEAIWRAGLKGLAIAASVIPYGQPVLGQVVGNGLNAAADQIGNVEAGSDAFVGGILTKMDFSGVIKSLADKQVKGLSPGKDADYVKPKGNDKYKEDLEKYDKIKAKKNKELSEMSGRALNITSSYLKYSTSESELESRVAKLRATSVDFESVSRKINVLNKKKAVIFSDLHNAIQGTVGIEAKIMQTEANIFKLIRNQATTVYNQELEEAFTDVKEAASKRLKLIEYQLIKSYEYTTLTPFNQNNSAFDIFIQKYNEEKKGITKDNLTSVITKLKVAYDGQRAEMSTKILNDNNLEFYVTDNSHSRNIILASDKNKGVLSNKLLDEFNKEKSVTIDLQKDFVNEIIKPYEENIKIKSIELLSDNIRFASPLTGSVDIILEILDGGILRKDDNLFMFKTGNPNGVSNRWTWTVQYKDNKLDISGSSFPEEYQKMISFLTGNEDLNDKVSSFTSPPAWSRCRLTIKNNSGNFVPEITYMAFGLMATRKVNATVGNEVVLDIKTENAPLGTIYTLTEGSNVAQKSDEHVSNYYGIYTKEKTVNVTLGPEPEGAASKFEKWIIYDTKNINGVENKDKNIKLVLGDDIRIVAVFKDVNLPTSAPLTANQKIILYEDASETAKVIAVEADDSLIVPIPDKQPVKGFQRVAYRGMQEAFIKKE